MQRIPLYLLLVLICCISCQNQQNTEENIQQDSIQSHSAIAADTLMLSKAFELFKEPNITKKRFKHKDIEPLLYKLPSNPSFKLHKLGESVQHRNIYQVEYGYGEKKVMLWSQMHGDESTATMALMDIFNFLSGSNDEFDSVRTLIKENTLLYFIPMLNPDGAEIFNRRNAMGIDINRDARAGTTPEGKILINAAKAIEPQYGFNLHDQQLYYAAGFSNKPASISFLAPAYNYERDTNTIRSDAMRMIVGMNQLLQNYIHGGVAKYDDSHEPRGFGDNFQKWGARTVLIETGGYANDPEKQYLRKLNFYIILNSLIDIATDNYKKYDANDYEDIPENRTKISDLVIRNISYKTDSLNYKTDLAIYQDQYSLEEGDYFLRGRVADVGDLLESYGYNELDANGLTFTEGKFYEKPVKTISEITPQFAQDLIKKGYYGVRIKEMPKNKLYHLPILILRDGREPGGGMQIGMPANFFLSKNGKLQYAVINGSLIDLSKPITETYNQYVR